MYLRGVYAPFFGDLGQAALTLVSFQGNLEIRCLVPLRSLSCDRVKTAALHPNAFLPRCPDSGLHHKDNCISSSRNSSSTKQLQTYSEFNRTRINGNPVLMFFHHYHG